MNDEKDEAFEKWAAELDEWVEKNGVKNLSRQAYDSARKDLREDLDTAAAIIQWFAAWYAAEHGDDNGAVKDAWQFLQKQKRKNA
jgi:hypothetical protein